MAKPSGRDCQSISDAIKTASLALERLSERPQRRRRKETAQQIGAKGAGKSADVGGQRMTSKAD